MAVFCRAPFNYDADKVSTETGLKCEDMSLAQQNQKDEVDINFIVRKFMKTGELPDNYRAPRYGDFTEITDFQTALNAVNTAEESFMMLPADLRSRFGNDPQAFVAFCSDERNLDEMIRLGLAKKRPDVPATPPASPVQTEPPQAEGIAP